MPSQSESSHPPFLPPPIPSLSPPPVASGPPAFFGTGPHRHSAECRLLSHLANRPGGLSAYSPPRPCAQLSVARWLVPRAFGQDLLLTLLVLVVCCSPTRSPLLHPALSTSLSRSFGLNSPFSLSALSSSLTALSSSPGFSSMSMSLGRSFEERPKLEAQFFRNFSCCGLDLQDLHGLLEHFEECHVAFEDDGATDGGMEVEMDMDDGGSDGTISGPPSPRLQSGGRNSSHDLKKSALGQDQDGNRSPPDSPSASEAHLDSGMELDMDMDDAPDLNHLTLASTSSLSNGTLSFQPPPMSAFDSPHSPNSQLGGLGNLMPSAASNSSANKKKFSTAMNPHGQSRGLAMGGMGGLVGLDALTAARAASAYSTPDSSSVPGTPTHEPNGDVSLGFAPLNPSTGLAPSLLFPGTPADSPPSDDERGDGNSTSSSGGGRSDRDHSLPPSGSIVPSATSSHLAGLPPHLAALSPAQLTALHPLGTGVQISPSGRPYTPPSEKPFKCSVAGCDKSYKQQNGLKYHRLHGHCNQNNVGKEGAERGEGKPYVCHVLSCGKRYKKYVFFFVSLLLPFLLSSTGR